MLLDVLVDEAMIAYQGRLSFRQYIPAKPTKYGIKVWEACDARNGFCYDFNVYLGRPMGMEARESPLGKKTVLKLTEKLRDKHYHVYFDNYFTSVELLKEFYKEKLTVVEPLEIKIAKSKVNDFQCELSESFYDQTQILV